MMIIIEMDGYFQQVLLTGKTCSKKELREKYLIAKELTLEIGDFPHVFCSLHNFVQLPYTNQLKVDFVIDTDTDRIYSRSY